MSQSTLWLPILACLAAGMLTAMQAPTNAMMVRPLGSPINAALVSFAVGTAILAAVALVMRVKPDLEAAGKLPVYAWIGGAYGAFFVTVAAYAAPKLGVASLVTLVIAGQIAASLMIDQFGGFGLAARAVTPARLLGAAFILLGVILVRRY